MDSGGNKMKFEFPNRNVECRCGSLINIKSAMKKRYTFTGFSYTIDFIFLVCKSCRALKTYVGIEDEPHLLNHIEMRRLPIASEEELVMSGILREEKVDDTYSRYYLLLDKL